MSSLFSFVFYFRFGSPVCIHTFICLCCLHVFDCFHLCFYFHPCTHLCYFLCHFLCHFLCYSGCSLFPICPLYFTVSLFPSSLLCSMLCFGSVAMWLCFCLCCVPCISNYFDFVHICILLVSSLFPHSRIPFPSPFIVLLLLFHLVHYSLDVRSFIILHPN